MTTVPRYSGVEEVLGRLDSLWVRRWMLRLVTAMLAVGAIAMAAVLAAALSLGYWPDQPPAALRMAMLLAGAGGILAAVVWFLLRAAVWKQNPAQVARFAEQHLPEVKNDLINTVLLAGDADQASPELVQLAIHEAALRAKRVDLAASISHRPLGRWLAAAVGLGAVLTAFALLQPGPFRRGLLGAVAPTAYLARANDLELLSLQPDDGATVFAGEHVAFAARIRNDERSPYAAEIILRDRTSPYPMIASQGHSTFRLTLRNVEQSFDYALRVGGSRWPADKPYYRVNVVQRVRIEGLDLAYSYPAYTGLKDAVVRNADGRIEAPLGSRVVATLRLASPVRNVVLDVQGASPVPMRGRGDGRSFSGELNVLRDGAYRIQLADTRQQLPDPDAVARDTFSAAGQSLMRGYFAIRALPDEPPKVEFVVPNRDTSVPPGGRLPTRLRLYDKYGLTDATFYAGKDSAEPRPVHHYAVLGKTKQELDWDFALPPDAAEGDVIVYYATASDNRNLPGVGGPQNTRSPQFKVLVQDAAKVAAEKARRFEELRRRLQAILDMQLREKVNAGICAKAADAARAAAAGSLIAAGQKALRAAMVDLADNFPFDKEMVSVQQTLAVLANNEAALAITQAEVLAKLAALAERDKAVAQLAATQDRIIDTLQTLLAIMPSLAGKKEPTTKPAQGADLPADALDKLHKLNDKLAEFIEEQKKVIAATERLTKKPVDNFTSEDDELLKELKATEDKWEKFMNEAFADFSKLVEQDFSNPSTLKELTAVKSDITMAKDALGKKATEIATAAEDSAMGGGKEIKSNIEKWLPDEPDRTKWAMEAPEGTAGKVEAPELPKELEDLVGDLLEQEEELFDEMEDLTSKAASSGDDAIGWDAMDGPISNMGAQGVTGNQLPNSMELSGRSGEGRQGKSSGEFVEDKAVGKGGRNTPTRLTPEPFQKGEVNDKSTEPPGGATGGGKLSGAGAEGLEGPVPPELKKEMPRLAAKQAAIANKAERLRAKFEVNSYAGFKFLQAITLMNRVKGDLDSYRYQNVMRTKDQTLAALKQSRLRIGEIDVTADESAGMPKYVRDNIADAMKGKLPEEFKDVLEQYYKRLSEQK